MSNKGFSMVELVIVLAIIGTLSAIAMFQFNEYSKRSSIESQLSMLHSELMNVKSDALFKKNERSVVLTANQLKIYPAANTSGDPSSVRQFKNVMTMSASDPLTFDSRGILNVSGNVYACVAVDSTASYDSLVLSATQIELGKREGASCDETNVKKR